ncbi:hypothetical protein ACSQ67_011045 [Phaseolus vulgaris]
MNTDFVMLEDFKFTHNNEDSNPSQFGNRSQGFQILCPLHLTPFYSSTFSSAVPFCRLEFSLGFGCIALRYGNAGL